MDASFKKAGSQYTLRLERRLKHSPEKVWRVLTERELLKQWFPCDIEGEWQVGAELRFKFPHGEHEDLTPEQLRGEVLSVDRPHFLEFRWGAHTIRCELIPDGDGCTLLFSETLDDPSMGARTAAGWEMCLERMELLIEGGTLAKVVWDVWRAKFKRYAKKFEPEHGPQRGAPENHPAATAEL